MNNKFITEDFIRQSRSAKQLYHDHAKEMPIFDYHCHLSPAEIAENKKFDNITQIWLYGDHYKWRAMRTNGAAEKYCTGDASDYEKFEKWAETVPYTIRNPLYHWTHLELKMFFDIDDKLLCPDTAKEIYDICNKKIETDDFKVQNIVKRSNVKVICTTDDPLDSLEYHKQIEDDDFSVKVLPTFRPDKGMAVENTNLFNNWVNNLEKVTGSEIKNFNSYLQAIQNRHDFFHKTGCRISDHGLDTMYAEDYTENEITNIFKKIREKKDLDEIEAGKFKSAMLIEFGKMDHKKKWAQQFHLGVIRNNNSRMFKKTGPDTGFDSIGDFNIAQPLVKFLNKLDKDDRLPSGGF